MTSTFYYITCADSNPHNHSCKRFIIDSKYNWVCGNGEGSDQWDKLVGTHGGFRDTCKYLIHKLGDKRRNSHNHVHTDGCWVSKITEVELETLFPEEAW